MENLGNLIVDILCFNHSCNWSGFGVIYNLCSNLLI